MIIVRIVGGLGNQMFQYAMGRALALRRGTSLGLDTRWYRGGCEPGDTPRAFQLDRFRLLAEEAPASLLPLPAREFGVPMPRLHPRRVYRGLCRRIAPYWRLTRYCVERGYAYDAWAARQIDGAYLAGCWQSERYFADAADAIRRDFTLRAAPDAENRRWLARIAAAPCAVAMHVRRTDYVGARVHGPCSLDYYRRGIELIERRAGARATLFAFSDDPGWARENLRLDRDLHFADHNDAALGGPEDLRLMAACDHQVIANSSLSWWAAWLNPAPRKVVVAPTPWFRTAKLDERDILPTGWEKLPSGVRAAA